MRVVRHESTAPHHQLVDDQEGEYTLRISATLRVRRWGLTEHRVLQAERGLLTLKRGGGAEARTAIADAGAL